MLSQRTPSLLKALAGVWALGYLVGCATASPAPGAPPGWGARAWIRYLTDPLPAEGGDTAEQALMVVPPGMPSPWEEQRTPAQLAEARTSEVARAWATVDSLSSASLPPGARLRFLWWKQQGAFTLLSHQALRPLAPASAPPQRPHALQHEVKRLLGDMAGQHSLGLSEGLGPRTTRLHLRAVHTHGSARAQAWVEEAGLVQPERPPLLDEDFAAAWYAMYEEILRRWPEEVKDGSQWVLQRGAEEFALWYVGGIIGKGAGALLEFVPKVMQTVLARGGPEAAAWLRTALVRLSPVEKESFQRLWAKLLVEGEQALTLSERHALRQTMLLLEQRLAQPLTMDQKKSLRYHSRRLYAELKPELAHILKTQAPQFPVHHRQSLEYAHLFPDEDINAAYNLCMVKLNVHKRINAIWDSFRRSQPKPTRNQVKELAQSIDRHFKQWYDRVDIPDELPQSVFNAEEAVRREVQHLLR